VEFADSEIEDLSPKRFVQKHLAGDLNADQESRGSQGGSCEVRLGGVWEASRDPALPGSPVRRVAAGKPPSGLGRSLGRIAVRRRPAEVSGMSRVRDRYPWLPGFRDNTHQRIVAAARRHELIC